MLQKSCTSSRYGKIAGFMVWTGAAFYLGLGALWVATRGEASGAHVAVSLSASMPRGVWVLERFEQENSRLSAGQAVAIDPPAFALEHGCVRRGQMLLKYVVATPGQSVCVGSGGEVMREGRVISGARPPGGAGVPVGVKGCVKVEPGAVWVGAPHPRSCDSRYYGPVPRSSVRATATPWLTLEAEVSQ